MRVSVLVHEVLQDGRFVVTSNCREDIPQGWAFTTMSARTGEVVQGEYRVAEEAPAEPIQLLLGDIETWRKPWPCIPYGHHAAVRFEGRGVVELTAYLVGHPRPWIVVVHGE